MQTFDLPTGFKIIDSDGELLLPRGYKINDKEILQSEPIGRGGFGYVFKAWKPIVKNYYAVKIFYPRALESITDFEAREKIFNKVLDHFKNEQIILVEYKHKNIVRIEDIGVFRVKAESRTTAPQVLFPFYVMEFIEDSVKGKKYDLNNAINLILQVCDALIFLHEKGVIHRDIKPENLLLKDDETIKVSDFGISRILTETGTTTSFTQVRTPGYGPPEQATGDKLDYTADIYATAKTLFTMLTNQFPPEGQITSLPSGFADFPRYKELLQILKTATADRIEDREFKNVLDFKTNLFHLETSGRQVSQKPGPEPVRKQEKEQPRPKRFHKGILFIFMLAIAAVIVIKVPAMHNKALFYWHKIQQNVNIPPSEKGNASSYFEQGIKWYDVQNWQKARNNFEQAIKIDGQNAEYQAYLGLASAEMNDGEQAIRAWKKAVELKPDKPEYKINLGKVYSQFGKPQKAVEVWQLVLKQTPNNELVKILIQQEKRNFNNNINE